LWRYLNSPPHDSREVAWHLIHLAWSSPAALAIAPLQDLLNLGAEARMNVPGHVEGNWSWRATEKLLSSADFDSLRELTEGSNRLRMFPRALANKMAEAAL
jgi:4-alpha-glucanotransferase